MTTSTLELPGGTWQLGDTTVPRFGYGAMQLAGPGVFGPPADRDAAASVLRDAVSSGITHIDTSETYGPRVVNELIRDALHPAERELFIATKAGGRRDASGGWPPARTPDELRRQIDDNLETLGVDVLDLVHLRMGDANGPVQPASPGSTGIAEYGCASMRIGGSASRSMISSRSSSAMSLAS